jgi:hypothetical protein
VVPVSDVDRAKEFYSERLYAYLSLSDPDWNGWLVQEVRRGKS